MGNGARRYSPSSFVTSTTCATCSAGLVAVTVTPGSTAPLWSVTCPMIDAVLWPAAGDPASARRPTTSTTTLDRTHHEAPNVVPRIAACLSPGTGPGPLGVTSG